MQSQRKGLTFERIEMRTYPNTTFRPNTPCVPTKMNFVMLNGGGGDYITWMRSIQWLCEVATWIDGNLICPSYFKELAEYWLKTHRPRWGFHLYNDMQNLPDINKLPCRGPIELQRESLNATGAHLMTCGWVYFTNKEKAPVGYAKDGRPWSAYPLLDQEMLDNVPLPDEAKSLKPGSYAVITTGITTDTRRSPDGAWNPIIEYVKNKGLIPVFLGKSVVETGNRTNIHTEFSELNRYDLGLDLRNKTTLMQAASIISRAKFIVGLDNGLLHLAGCTETPIIFGYTLASPEHREPTRPSGNIYNVVLEPGELSCYHCQSNNNFVIGFNYRSCMYSDLKCIDLLFDGDCRRWKAQMDLCLNKGE